MKIEFSTRKELMKWLKNSSSAVLLSIALIGGAQEVQVQASSAKSLIGITQASENYFEEGAYAVEYETISSEEDDDFVYTNIATAFTIKTRLAHHPEDSFGGLKALRKNLLGFEYTAKIKLEEVGYIGRLLIVIPANPEELERLKKILHQFSIAYIFPDGTGTINENNLKMGQGLWA